MNGSCYQDNWVEFWFVVVVLGNCLVPDVGFLQAKSNGHGLGQVEERAVVWDDSCPVLKSHVTGPDGLRFPLVCSYEVILIGPHCKEEGSTD